MTDPKPRRRADDLFDRWDKRVRDVLLWIAGMVLILNEALIQRLVVPPGDFEPSYLVLAVGGLMVGLPIFFINDELRRNRQAQPPPEADDDQPA